MGEAPGDGVVPGVVVVAGGALGGGGRGRGGSGLVLAAAVRWRRGLALAVSAMMGGARAAVAMGGGACAGVAAVGGRCWWKGVTWWQPGDGGASVEAAVLVAAAAASEGAGLAQRWRVAVGGRCGGRAAVVLVAVPARWCAAATACGRKPGAWWRWRGWRGAQWMGLGLSACCGGGCSQWWWWWACLGGSGGGGSGVWWWRVAVR